MKISIVIPIFNEEKNIHILYNEIVEVFSNTSYDYEILCVNDHSRDGSLSVLRGISERDKRVKVINFGYNSGQTAAMSAGIKNASGDLIIPMDADLQNDPKDIPRFIKKIEEGYDVVSGWRKDRKDDLLLRKIPSQLANLLIGKITGIAIHDYGCSMKAYKKEIIQGVNLYGEMHRFIPAYASWKGARISEIVVNHRPRINGVTNYGISRTFRVILDLIVIKFMSKYMNRPIHFFGGVGFISFGLGLVFGLLAIILKIFGLRDFVATPLPVFSALLIIVGIQLIAIGIVSEILMRTYYESQNKVPYDIREKINL